jgi:hypothetical protein
MGERRGTYMDLERKPEGRRQFRSLRNTWEDNVKVDLREVGWESMEWINLAQDNNKWRVVLNAVMDLRVP